MENELIKAEEPGTTQELAVDTPVTGTDASVGDPEKPVDYEALEDQTMASDGVYPEAVESEGSELTPDPVANDTVPDVANQSFWNGFFGSPKIPRVE